MEPKHIPSLPCVPGVSGCPSSFSVPALGSGRARGVQRDSWFFCVRAVATLDV